MQAESGQIHSNIQNRELVDSFGRVHHNLRISVTDRCNLRCSYCMPQEVAFLDRSELLTFEEITRVVQWLVPLGIDKVRLTGGEPLLRRHLAQLVALLANVPGIGDLGLTTNGILLPRQAAPLFQAGLRRINISLDTLDRKRFQQLARRDDLDRVLEGIAAARQAGFAPIKINAVSIRGLTDGDVVPLAHFGREQGLEIRFIEYMPIGADRWERERVYFAQEILEQLSQRVCPLVPVENQDPRVPAQEFVYTDGRGRVGIIASVSRPFCLSCNRIRLTAEGKLRNCLFAHEEIDLKPFLRPQGDDAALIEAVRRSVANKGEGHEINTARFVKPLRNMHAIGG
jgi:cyclic pyranopterin phosphate synthase